MNDPSSRSPDSASSRVAKWIRTSGFPLEMRVANALRMRGFRVAQSEYFVDPDTGKHRELDIAADFLEQFVKGDDGGPGLGIRMHLAVSCKSNRSKPWAAFCSPAPKRRHLEPSNTFTSHRARTLLSNLDLLGVLQDPGYFMGYERLAHGVTVAHTADGDDDRRDVAFDSARSLVKVCDIRLVESTTTGSSERPMPRHGGERSNRDAYLRGWCTFVVPLMVVDGCVCDVSLDEGESVVVAEVPHVRWHWRSRFGDRESVYVDVVTEAGLPAFLDGLVSDLRAISAACGVDTRLVNSVSITFMQKLMYPATPENEEEEDGQ